MAEIEKTEFEFPDEIEPCLFQSFKHNSKYNFSVNWNKEMSNLIFTPNNSNVFPIILDYKLYDKNEQS